MGLLEYLIKNPDSAQVVLSTYVSLLTTVSTYPGSYSDSSYNFAVKSGLDVLLFRRAILCGGGRGGQAKVSISLHLPSLGHPP